MMGHEIIRVTHRQVVDRDGARRADLAAIHVAKKALSWDDGTYRDIMFTVCRVRSAADMDFTGRKRFLAHLRACQQQMGIDVQPARPRVPWSPQMRMLWSLWQRLADAGLVDTRDKAALTAWVKRQTGVDVPEWCTTQQLDAVIESAKNWLARNAAEKDPS
jgi:phage gp16-like protein